MTHPATPRTALRGLYDPCRTMEEYVTDKLDALIARLEAATEGSRELDIDIRVGLFGKESTFCGCTGACKVPPFRCPAIPSYTTSLDSALSLVPEGWIWDVTSTGQAWAMPDQSASERTGVMDQVVAHARAPALALTIAALKARRGN